MKNKKVMPLLFAPIGVFHTVSWAGILFRVCDEDSDGIL